ncbi:MAG TPA: GNAT family N-acetyltransferase [Steroidobacter sp.]|uniref:GNAT family N-acetyltransferase n=1 Tax=Steroidobacter sp. TaxID=1978227 RepID=UPI002ED7C4B1
MARAAITVAVMRHLIRQARAADVAAMHRVRLSVQENRLVSTQLTERDYLVAIEATGRGWVLELAGNVVAFAIGNAANGSIWALFVEPGYERRGFGRELHDIMIEWLWEQGHDRLWLSTDAGTRAERFYLAAGWRRAGVTERGEIRFELSR